MGVAVTLVCAGGPHDIGLRYKSYRFAVLVQDGSEAGKGKQKQQLLFLESTDDNHTGSDDFRQHRSLSFESRTVGDRPTFHGKRCCRCVRAHA